MSRIVSWVEAFASSLWGPGLFVVAFLDSSFLSLPEINDVFVVLLVTRNKALMPYYAAMATLGSITGCLVLYVLGRKGGEVILRKRFTGPRLEKALGLFQRFGVLAIVVPALLRRRRLRSRSSFSSPGSPGCRGLPSVERSRSGAGCATSAKVCWRCVTGIRRSSSWEPTGRWCRWCWRCSCWSEAAPTFSCVSAAARAVHSESPAACDLRCITERPAPGDLSWDSNTAAAISRVAPCPGRTRLLSGWVSVRRWTFTMDCWSTAVRLRTCNPCLCNELC